MGGGTGSLVLDPLTGEPVGHRPITANTHPSVISSYVLDSTPGSTAMSTYEGHQFDMFNPDSWVFDIEDIAKSLSNICRFGGHVEFYSVAEHCLRVAAWLRDAGYGVRIQLMGLMHDAVEAYIGDIVRPIKKTFSAQGETIVDLERSMEYALFRAYDILEPELFDDQWKAIKEADMAIYQLERDERPSVGHGYHPATARMHWMTKFTELQALIGE